MQKLSDVERIKENSDYLRGTLVESVANEVTGAFYPDDTQLIKFHGFYQQTDRDLDSERKQQKLEPLFSYMLRIRVPGGVMSPAQWLRLDELSTQYGSSTLKLTTRQAIQLHGVAKRHLEPVIKGFSAVMMDSIAGCGDVNRNVMCHPNPGQSALHGEVYAAAAEISQHFTPRSKAYYELWLDGKQIIDLPYQAPVAGGDEDEPIYGKTYLPRKFKIALAIPPYNDTDIFANDIGLIAIEKDGALEGYNMAVGGGLGMTFGMPDTYPRLADMVGYVGKNDLIAALESVITIQRDWGNRENRKYSRLKYTLDKVGLPAFKAEMERRSGLTIQPARPYQFERSGDVYGWSDNEDGTSNLLLFVEGGRIRDHKEYLLKTALRKIAELHDGDFRLTGNQNLMICRIRPDLKILINRILEGYRVLPEQDKSGLRLNSIACVAFNTCTLAFAEAERYLPSLIDKIDAILAEHNLLKDEIIIRMTGCPNGCGRPYLGEIGLIGRAIGKYNLYLGAAFNGERMNRLYKEMLDEAGILTELRPVIADYAANRVSSSEPFGDFVVRKGYVAAPGNGLGFH
jgi:sulfite reductase (NADPH) hemoprotein beta-component